MSMRLEVAQKIALRMKCLACSGYDDQHDKDCPTGLKKDAVDKALRWRCPDCSGAVQVTTDDFLECRNKECRLRLSLGEFADCEDPRRVHIFRISPDEDLVPALAMKRRGGRGRHRSKFVIDVLVAKLTARERECRKKRREERAAERAAKALKKRAKVAFAISPAVKRVPVALSEEPCPRCLELARSGQIRAEVVQRMPLGAGVAPVARDGSGKCCFDCAFADGLCARKMGMDFVMARIAAGNCRQEQYRFPGVPMGLVLEGLRPSSHGDLEAQHAWLDRMEWFGVGGEE